MLNRWHLLAHISELANPGDFVCLPLTAQSEVAIMNYEGYIYAFDNRCPHRGARIFTTTHGNRPPVCAYHGRCAKPQTINPMPWRMEGGFIFVGVGSKVEPLQDTLLHDFVRGAPAALRLYDRQQFVMNCDWTVAVENALEVEHVEHVHAASLAKLGLKPDRTYCYGDGSSLEHMQSTEAMRLDKLEPVFEKAAPDFKSFGPGHDYTHAYFFPFAAVSSTRGFTYSLQNYFPMADGKTWFLHRLFVSPAPLGMSHYFESVMRMNRQVFAEDALICAQVPAAFAGKLGPQDDRIACFRGGMESAWGDC